MKVYLLWLSYNHYEASELIDAFDGFRKAYDHAESIVADEFVRAVEIANKKWANQALVDGVNVNLVEDLKTAKEKKDRWEYERDGDFGYSYTNGREHYYVQTVEVK